MLADAFNESLLTPTKSLSSTINTESPNLTSEEPDTELTPNNSRQLIFYESDEWEKFVDHVLANATTFKSKNTRTKTRMSTAISTTATFMPRSRSPSPSTTSKSKHQHNISDHCRQQISFFSIVCLTGYNEWQEEVKRLHFYCIILGKKLSCQHRTPTSPNTNFACVGAVVMSCIIQGNATHDT